MSICSIMLYNQSPADVEVAFNFCHRGAMTFITAIA